MHLCTLFVFPSDTLLLFFVKYGKTNDFVCCVAFKFSINKCFVLEIFVQIGVADGVGGWRNYGIDPGEFSSFLMSTCSRLVQSSSFNPERPVSLIASSYNELLEHKEPILGSSTACVLILNKENNMLYAANIGDSGFMVVRKGSIVHQSEEQTHYFNTPYQLSSPFHNSNVLSDRPESADEISFPVQKGDVILVATDGVFDNLPNSLILDTLTQVRV